MTRPRIPSPTGLSLSALGAVVLTATCSSSGGAAPSPAPHALPPHPQAPGPAVALSEGCVPCHSSAPEAEALRDGSERPVAPYDLWRSSMMANAALDPFFRAQLAAELAATPARADEIARACLRCHAPKASLIGLPDEPLEALDSPERVGELARDGVSCTLCHGMSPAGLGEPDTWSGAFRLDPERRLFGPHADPAVGPMQRFTAFTPAQGDHIRDAELCASCHTLESEAFAPDGSALSEGVLEQAAFLEWSNSSFAGAVACQSCHVPTRDEDGERIVTRIARNPRGRDFPFTEERAPYGRHTFVGGNTLVPALLRDHGEALGTDVPPEAFEATLQATRKQLEERTAEVELRAVRRAEDALMFRVRVENLTGHKLPTGHPSRRMWLRATVRDASGRVVFASGASDARGRILGGDGAPLASERAGAAHEPHRDVVRSPDEVASYQSILRDTEGNATYVLLRGTGYARDDRLLPKGWRADGPYARRTAPVGVEGDEDFNDGSDEVRFEVPVRGAESPLTIEVELCYQTLSARWLAELLRFDLPEVRALQALLETADLAPEVLARARVEAR